MLFRVLADVVLVLHLLFVIFVVTGALGLSRWSWLPWLHLPAVFWALVIEFGGVICPLTPLENRLRHWGGEAGYTGGFIEHYVWPLIYPAGLTRESQIILGLGVLAINLVLYWRWWRQRHG